MGDTPHEISVGEGKQISREDADLLTIEMICAQEDEITTLTARVAELEGALKPFKDAAATLNKTGQDEKAKGGDNDQT